MSDALPEFLTGQTQDVILQRMLGNVPAGVDTTEGSFVYDAVAPASIELATAAIWVQQVLQYGFATTTFGAYLDLRCDEVGLTSRKAATCATQTLTIIGAAGTPIAAGQVVCTPADNATGTASIEFTTQADATIPAGGSVNVPITAVLAGAAGNVALGTVTVMEKPIDGVASISNTAMNGDGLDVESDSALLARYLAKVQNQGTSGNKADYINWAMEVAGVGNANCIPLWAGPGTVKVVIIDENGQPADAAIVAAASAHITAQAPIGATPTTVAATALPINVAATLTLATGYTTVQANANFVSNLASYLAAQAFVANPANPAQNLPVSYAQLGKLLLSTAGIADYTGLTVNGGTANIAVASDTAAVPGTVTF